MALSPESAGRFFKSEFVVSVAVALLVTAFVHTSARKRRREGLPDPAPNLFKVFAVTLCAAYLIMYILAGKGEGGRPGEATARAASAAVPGMDSAIREAMRYIDAGDPDF